MWKPGIVPFAIHRSGTRFNPFAECSNLEDKDYSATVLRSAKCLHFHRLFARVSSALPWLRVKSRPLIIQVDRFDTGYPNLAAFKDSSETFGLYRRYGYLQSRMLLERQDELRVLEEQLEAFDEANPEQLTSRPTEDEQQKTRKELFEKLELSFMGYGMPIIFRQMKQEPY